MWLWFRDGVEGGVLFFSLAVWDRLRLDDPDRGFLLYLASGKAVGGLWYLQGGAVSEGGAGGGGSRLSGRGGGWACVVGVGDDDRRLFLPDRSHSSAGFVRAALVGAGSGSVFENLCLVVRVYFLVDPPGWAFGGTGEVRVSLAVVALADAVLDAAAGDLATDHGTFVLGGFVFSPAVFAHGGVHAHSPDVVRVQVSFAVCLVEVGRPFPTSLSGSRRS